SGPSGWFEVPPRTGLTHSTPAAAIERDILRLFVAGIDDRIWENDLTPSGWSDWFEIPSVCVSANGEVRDCLTPSGPATDVDDFDTFTFVTLYFMGEDQKIFSCDNTILPP